MKKVDYKVWIKHSEKELENLLTTYSSIYLIGHSMGGVIASYLASKYPSKIKKLILIAPGFEIGNYHQIKNDFISLIKRENKYETSGFEGLLHKVLTVPLSRTRQLKLLVSSYKNSVFQVKCPVLFIHGDIDNIVSLKSTINVYNKIETKKWLTVVSGVRHKMFISSKKDIVSSYILMYINGGLNWILNKKNKL